MRILTLLFFAIYAAASAAIVEWDFNPPEEPVAGYRVYWGSSSRGYFSVQDVGNTNSVYVPNPPPGSTFYYAVTAYDVDGLESYFSDEVSLFIPGDGPPPDPVVTNPPPVLVITEREWRPRARRNAGNSAGGMRGGL
jgi:hypothetical protein